MGQRRHPPVPALSVLHTAKTVKTIRHWNVTKTTHGRVSFSAAASWLVAGIIQSDISREREDDAMMNHESHGHGGGHAWGHNGGHAKMGGPLRVFFVNAMITQFIARIWMVVSAIALIKIAKALSLGARVKVMKDLGDDLTPEQRAELLDDIWRRARRKRMANCPAMLPWCSSEDAARK